MTAKVIDFFVEAGKRGVPRTATDPEFVTVEPPPRLSTMQRKCAILLDLIGNEFSGRHADPSCFFVLYGTPWKENPKEICWNYLTMEFTPKQLREGVETIIKDMEARAKKK